ncbi:MAG: sigma 54-interacting transcriptional regulator [Magnetococcales bacterium]|nr:sigma 54-interacting transcriptional regulator [Magnetococcales bacterium]
MEFLLPFLDGLEEGVIFLDSRRYIMAINRAASHMFDKESAAVIGELCPRLFEGFQCAQACIARHDCALIPTASQKTRTVNLSLNRMDGTRIILSMWSVLLPEQEGAARYAIILRDRTREALLEEETRERLRFGGMIGHSPVMRTLFQFILQAAISQATVLISGESGTGKELIAKALHDNSSRNHGPYVRVHCASFPETLLESELFGYKRGAFTGAQTDRIGRFEEAHGGSILLDEIGEISLLSQVKLLRVLQEKEVARLGENRLRKVDVRVIAATHRDLAGMVREGTFREDLYYRLSVLPIHVPPLRERHGDISLLVHALLGKMALRDRRQDIRVSDEAMSLLDAYPWPGNVRELANVLENALVHMKGDLLLPQHFQTLALKINVLPFRDQARHHAAAIVTTDTVRYYRAPDDALEKEQIAAALREARGNKTIAAKKLGMSRTTLWKRMKDYNL